MTNDNDEEAPPLVLVVEDNPVNRLLAASQLDALGCEHEFATTAAEALIRGLDGAYDLVLMDYHLPDLDGMETTRRLRAGGARTRQGRPVPIIAVTASAMAGDRERCLEAGMDDFLPKPVTIDALEAAIERWVPTTARDAEVALGDAVPARASAAAPDRWTDLPDLDLGILSDLGEQLGDRETLQLVVAAYLGELGLQLTALGDAARTRDDATIASIAHVLKSSSAIVGAAATSELCRRAEVTALHGRGTDALVPALCARAMAAAEALRRALPELAER